MKVIFEFDTDKENFDISEYERIKYADDMAKTLYEITEQLKSWYKYDKRGEIPIDEVYDKIFDIIQENHINLDKLYY